MKKHIKTTLALLFVAASFTYCAKEDDNTTTPTTTTTTSSTSTTGTPTGNTVTIDGTTINLTTVSCVNQLRPTISTFDSVTVIAGSVSSGSNTTQVEAVFFSPNAAQGVYGSVADDLSMAAGKCLVTILRSGSVDEELTMKANQQVTLRITGTSRKVEISSKAFDYTSTSSTGIRTVSTNYGCD
ncbi:MAG: hypothetical protein ACK45I_09635 [Bacteroidota bacterium]|jgi:hypothetical protein